MSKSAENENSRDRSEETAGAPYGLGWMREEESLFDVNKTSKNKGFIKSVVLQPGFALIVSLLALVIGGGAVHYKGVEKKKAQSAALATQKKPAFLYVTMRCGERLDTFEDARAAYETGNYEQTIHILKAILEIYPTLELTHYNLGVTYLLAGYYKEAINELQTCVLQLDGVFEEQARWYLANAYLKSGQVNECQTELEKLIQSGETYKLQAKGLYDRIKRIIG